MRLKLLSVCGCVSCTCCLGCFTQEIAFKSIWFANRTYFSMFSEESFLKQSLCHSQIPEENLTPLLPLMCLVQVPLQAGVLSDQQRDKIITQKNLHPQNSISANPKEVRLWCGVSVSPEKPAQSGSPQGSPPEQEEVKANHTSHLKEVSEKSSVGRNLVVI